MLEKIDLEVDDFLSYCDFKNLAVKTISSYEQTLRLFIRYLKDYHNITKTEDISEKIIREYLTNVKERGKYTIVANDNTKKFNNPQNRQDFGKKVSPTTVNNYTRNIRVYINYMYDNRMITINPMKRLKPIKIPRKVKDYLEDIEFNKLLNVFDLSKFHEYRDYTITKLIFDTGMRIRRVLEY